ncbi:hypothetical protein H5410_056262 [Solanum commersonii]|uniref:Uncharacterized protein n=1 Tax=Solanum commersonii TaxID=4109 RepID=A0A9J5WM78_SOLCO|nr:hypothetical protein H5410_056262 [Solanum commersonii]
MEVMDVRMMVIMEAMMIAMIKRQMGMIATILEESMRKMVIITLMVKMEKKKIEHCDGSYGDDGACERSYSHSESEDGSYDGARTYYTSHSKDEGEVRYNILLYKNYEEHAPKACENSYSLSCGNSCPSRSGYYILHFLC